MRRTILVFNDHSSEAEHAAELALNIAQKMNANLLLANIAKVRERVEMKETVSVFGKQEPPVYYTLDGNLHEYLQKLASKFAGYKPVIQSMDMATYSEADIASIVIKNDIWMMVKGTSSIEDMNYFQPRINVQSVLNRVMCPLLLVPEHFELKDFEHLVYTTDLRYCRLPVVKYLADFAAAYQADVMLANLSAKGLPHMEESYAMSVFKDEISNRIRFEGLKFNNITERNLNRVVDVMINGMHTDLLVMVNHRFHFEQIVGRYIHNALPSHINIPVLVFPY